MNIKKIEENERMHQLQRYLSDVWFFAVLLSNGTVLGFTEILGETEDFYIFSLMYDDDMERFGLVFGRTMIGSTTPRTTCHVHKGHVVAFQEVMDS